MTNVQLHLGDCLEVLRGLPDGCVDAVVTDPPYSSGARTAADVRGRGGMSRKEKWAANPLFNDRMTSTGFTWFIRELGREVLRVLVPGGSLLCFIDWRQYPMLVGALESVNFRVQMMLVWDKESIALGNGFRNQHELIVHAANGTPNVYDRATPNVLRVRRISSSDLHPTEKPVALMEKLIGVVAPVGGTVLDPLMGSGTTGVACVQTGRNFIGVEIDPGYYAIAQRRIAEAQMQPLLFATEPTQKEELA